MLYMLILGNPSYFLVDMSEEGIDPYTSYLHIRLTICECAV